MATKSYKSVAVGSNESSPAAAKTGTLSSSPTVPVDKPPTTVPLKWYWINCSGTGHVTMDETRLNQLFDKMPTLQFLLMGHPKMKQKATERMQNGIEMLSIPGELEVSKASFVLLTNCIFGIIPIPHPNVDKSGFDELIETATTLGGCDALEEQIKSIRIEPTTPEEDVNNEYFWANLCEFRSSAYDIVQLREEGYSWVKTVNVLYNGGSRNDHIYRAPKYPPTPQEAERAESFSSWAPNENLGMGGGGAVPNPNRNFGLGGWGAAPNPMEFVHPYAPSQSYGPPGIEWRSDPW